jgi:fatty acid-binding protein DegV
MRQFKMVEIARESAGSKKLHTAIAQANAPEDVEQLKQMLLAQFQCDELYVVDVPLITAVHNGQGLIEFGYYSSN